MSTEAHKKTSVKTLPLPKLLVVPLSILFSVGYIIREKSLLSTSYIGNMRLLLLCVKVSLSFVVLLEVELLQRGCREIRD